MRTLVTVKDGDVILEGRTMFNQLSNKLEIV